MTHIDIVRSPVCFDIGRCVTKQGHIYEYHPCRRILAVSLWPLPVGGTVSRSVELDLAFVKHIFIRRTRAASASASAVQGVHGATIRVSFRLENGMGTQGSVTLDEPDGSLVVQILVDFLRLFGEIKIHVDASGRPERMLEPIDSASNVTSVLKATLE